MPDGVVEVKFKPIAGKEDQAGGVVWRWKDSNNYYVARANALEGNVSLYYTLNGSRQTIAYKNAPVAPHRWHTLRVFFKGTTVQVARSEERRLGKACVSTHRSRRSPYHQTKTEQPNTGTRTDLKKDTKIK